MGDNCKGTTEGRPYIWYVWPLVAVEECRLQCCTKCTIYRSNPAVPAGTLITAKQNTNQFGNVQNGLHFYLL